MKSRLLACVLLGSLCFGVACKGGGGGDVAFLDVEQRVPERDAEDVIVDTIVAVRMNAAIKPATLSNNTFFLTDEDDALVPSMVRILDEPNADPSMMGTAAELVPNESLNVLTNYTVTVTTELQSLGGASLKEDYQWTFTTIDAAWGDAEWVEEPLANWESTAQQMAVDGQLGVMAVWELEEGFEEDTFIYANRYTRKGLWGEPEPIDDGNGRAAKPKVAADGDGNAFAVWERGETTSSDKKIWANRYDVENASWGSPALLQNGDITRAKLPSIAADPSGKATAVWVQNNLDTGREDVRAIRYEPGAGWGDAVTIGAPANNVAADRTAVGMDDQGGAIAVWDRRAGPAGEGGRVLWANRYTPGSGWGTAQQIKSDESTSANGFRLDVGAKGDAFVIWTQDNRGDVGGTGGIGGIGGTAGTGGTGGVGGMGGVGGTGGMGGVGGTGGLGGMGGTGVPEPRIDIYAIRFSGDEWDVEPTRIDKHDDGDKRAPDIAVDGERNAYAVWSQLDDANDTFENIWVAEYTPGSAWADPVLIEPKNPEPDDDGNATTPRIGVNRAGNVFVVWRQDWEGWGSIWSNRHDPGNGWVPADAERIENFASPARAPQIAVDEGRHAHSIWQHQADDRYKVRTNRFE